MKSEAVEKTCVDVGQEVVHRYRRVVGREFQTQRTLARGYFYLGLWCLGMRAADHEEDQGCVAHHCAGYHCAVQRTGLMSCDIFVAAVCLRAARERVTSLQGYFFELAGLLRH